MDQSVRRGNRKRRPSEKKRAADKAAAAAKEKKEARMDIDRKRRNTVRKKRINSKRGIENMIGKLSLTQQPHFSPATVAQPATQPVQPFVQTAQPVHTLFQTAQPATQPVHPLFQTAQPVHPLFQTAQPFVQQTSVSKATPSSVNMNQLSKSFASMGTGGNKTKRRKNRRRRRTSKRR